MLPSLLNPIRRHHTSPSMVRCCLSTRIASRQTVGFGPVGDRSALARRLMDSPDSGDRAETLNILMVTEQRHRRQKHRQQKKQGNIRGLKISRRAVLPGSTEYILGQHLSSTSTEYLLEVYSMHHMGFSTFPSTTKSTRSSLDSCQMPNSSARNHTILNDPAQRTSTSTLLLRTPEVNAHTITQAGTDNSHREHLSLVCMACLCLSVQNADDQQKPPRPSISLAPEIGSADGAQVL